MFARLVDDAYEIHTIKPDGAGLKRLTFTHGNDAHMAWSPDGESIAFASSASRKIVQGLSATGSDPVTSCLPEIETAFPLLSNASIWALIRKRGGLESSRVWRQLSLRYCKGNDPDGRNDAPSVRDEPTWRRPGLLCRSRDWCTSCRGLAG
jgi:hypothetical protein